MTRTVCTDIFVSAFSSSSTYSSGVPIDIKKLNLPAPAFAIAKAQAHANASGASANAESIAGVSGLKVGSLTNTNYQKHLGSLTNNGSLANSGSDSYSGSFSNSGSPSSLTGNVEMKQSIGKYLVKLLC